MLTLITQWSIGFSVVALIILWGVYWWTYQAFEKTGFSKLACTAMLAIVASIQGFHGWALAFDTRVFEEPAYLTLLFASPVAFYGFCRELIEPQSRMSPLLVLAIIPVLFGPWAPVQVALPLAFAMGGLSAFWLTLKLHRLKDQRRHFELERFGLLGIALVACVIFAVGLFAPWLGERFYILAYANLTALALATILWLLLRYPDLLQKAIETVTTSYAVSTLKNHDCDALAKQLQTLMHKEQLYKDEDLSLGRLAESLGLSTHQTSELINTQFGISFSRLIRQYRINAAKLVLTQEPNASVLSVGLSVGFSSQSSFYTAFREVTGLTPGQYRKQHGILTRTE